MSPDDILEYASVAVGFKVKPGQMITVNEQCYGRSEEDELDYVSDKGAMGIIEDIEMMPNPAQLTITISILIEPEKGIYIHDTFDEDGIDPKFPFTELKTQESIEIERSESAEKKETKETVVEKKDPLPKPGLNATNADWTAYNDQQEELARKRDMEHVYRNEQPRYPGVGASQEDWDSYMESSLHHYP